PQILNAGHSHTPPAAPPDRGFDQADCLRAVDSTAADRSAAAVGAVVSRVSSSSRRTRTLFGASMPTRTLSPDIFTIVITIESPSRMRCDSLRERTSIENLRVFSAGSVTMYTTLPVIGQALLYSMV